MVKLLEFKITFNSQNAVFSPGQNFAGMVTINLNDSMKMRALRLHFKGRAYVHWTERERRRGRKGQQRTVTRHYRASETYFDSIVILAGSGASGFSGNTAMHLPAGRSDYPFSFQLPSNLPSSFEGANGYVRYFVKATIDKPWKFDHNTKAAFTVLCPLDLNLDPSSKISVSATNSKTLCCLCCASGPIQAELYLDRGGYVPGEFIFVNGRVENLSSRELESTKAELIITIRYIAPNKTKTAERVVASITRPGCNPRSSLEWSNEKLQIPPLPTSMLQHCNIIDIFYTLQLVVVVPFGSFNLKASVPITIGSVPLNDLTPFNHPVRTSPNAAPVPLAPSAPHLPVAAMPTDISSFQPPPTFATAFGDPANIKDDDDNDFVMGQTSFSPQYPYYDWGQSAFSYS